MPPVFVTDGIPEILPPQTIIFDPVHTAVCPLRAVGASVVDISVHTIGFGGGTGISPEVDPEEVPDGFVSEQPRPMTHTRKEQIKRGNIRAKIPEALVDMKSCRPNPARSTLMSNEIPN